MTEDLLRRLSLANEARKHTKPWSWGRKYWTRVSKVLERKANQAKRMENFQ